MASLTDNTAVDFTQVTESEPRATDTENETSTVRAEIPKKLLATEAGTTSEMEVIVDPSSVKLIARSIAELTRDEEYKLLLEQKRTLLKKKYSEGLTKKDELALQLTIWNIDRIEDAQYGKNLDALEAIVKAHEAAAVKVARTVENFDRLIRSRTSRPGAHSRR